MTKNFIMDNTATHGKTNDADLIKAPCIELFCEQHYIIKWVTTKNTYVECMMQEKIMWISNKTWSSTMHSQRNARCTSHNPVSVFVFFVLQIAAPSIPSGVFPARQVEMWLVQIYICQTSIKLNWPHEFSVSTRLTSLFQNSISKLWRYKFRNLIPRLFLVPTN